MVDIFTGTVPNLTQSQPNFDTNTQAILDYIGNLAPQLNEWVGAYVHDTSSTSSTSNTIGTGSKSFTVEAGKGYKVNMPIRASATTGNYMDGIVTAYSGTSLTINFTSSNGSGTFSSWQIFLTIPGSNVTLGSNTFTGDQIVPDEAYNATGWNGNSSVPTKNAVRDKIEAILSAILNSTNDPTFSSASTTDPTSPDWVNGRINARSFGIGQTYQDVGASRAASTTYTNSTGKTIYLSITFSGSGGASLASLTINGIADVVKAYPNSAGTPSFTLQAAITHTGTYSINLTSATISKWMELRA